MEVQVSGCSGPIRNPPGIRTFLGETWMGTSSQRHQTWKYSSFLLFVQPRMSVKVKFSRITARSKNLYVNILKVRGGRISRRCAVGRRTVGMLRPIQNTVNELNGNISQTMYGSL